MTRIVHIIACVIGVVLGASCGGIRIGPTTWAEPAARLPAPRVSQWVLEASADVVVHDTDRWERRNLRDEPWLMVGADRTPGFWYAYLQFDLTQVPARAEIASAELTLTVEPEPPLPGEDTTSTFHVHVVHGAWTEDTITWNEQPLIGRRPVASFDVGRYDGRAVDVADVSTVVSAAVASGAAQVSFVIVPADPRVDLRRRWTARTPDAADDGTDMRLPRLTLRAGPTPAAPTQAELETRRR